MLERRLVVADRRVVRMERERAIAGVAQRVPCRIREWSDVLSGGARELESAEVVVGEHLRVIFGATERLDPLRRAPVLGGALAARDLPVRDLPDQGMPDHVLRLSTHHRPPFPLPEVAPAEATERFFALAPPAVPDRGQPAPPERTPCTRGILEQLF